MKSIICFVICLIIVFIILWNLCCHNSIESFRYSKIPKVIHKVYIQHDGKIPKNLNKNIINAHYSWKKMNPEYEIKFWSLDDCREYLSKNFPSKYLATFDCIQAYAGKCDFFRYCIVFKEGGWYSDWKEICLVDNLLNIISESHRFVYFDDRGNSYSADNSCISNAFFGSVPRHPILRKAIKLVIKNNKKKYYGDNPLDTTGVCVFREAIEKCNRFRRRKFESQGEYNTNDGGGHFYDNKLGKIIQHKCNDCGENQDWNKGNNYNNLWEQKTYYCND
jgi:mannosyltransferase OCH1-like enzyme